MAKKDGKALRLFERICVQLIFLLSAFLILFLGIRAAGSTIDFAQSERIEIINNLVEGLSEGDRIANQSKKLQTVVYRYLEAFVRAVAGFEFVHRPAVAGAGDGDGRAAGGEPAHPGGV